MPTANDLVQTAANYLGVLTDGETLTASQSEKGFNGLNSMLDFWSIEKLMIYQIVQSTYAWTGGNSQTIGVGGDLNGPRPIAIEEGCFFRDAYGSDFQVIILRDRADWDRIISKQDAASYPDFLYYEPGYPLGTLYAYPIPSPNLTLHINHFQPLQQFTSKTESLSLPPGYQYMIENNLAVFLERIFQVPAPDSVRMEAMKTKKGIKRINHIPIFAATEVSGILNNRRRANILNED